MNIKSLAELTSRRYKIFKDESWHHERSEVRTADWMWYEQLHCPNDLSFIGLYILDPIIYQFLYKSTHYCREDLGDYQRQARRQG